jgi:AAA15 family ATPase/GTPase
LKDTKENIYIPDKLSIKLLKSISIYGSNSAGKSNLLKAFSFFKYWVHNSFSEANKILEIPVHAYLLREGYDQKNSFFEVIFYVGEIKYRYGCNLTKEAIREEWLFYSEPKKREQHYFMRVGQEISYNNAWKKSVGVKIEPIIPYVKPRVLFISVLSQFNIDIGNLTLDWFHQNIIAFDLNDDYFINKAADLLQVPEYFIAIHHLVNKAQLGFNTIESKVVEKPQKQKRFNKDFLDFALNDPSKEYDIQTKHDVYNEKDKIVRQVFFDLKNQESAGTQKFFALLGALLNAIKNKQILWIDELDSRFHPLLFQTIISFFNSNKFNHRGAQMIFTTHSTQLLKQRTIRRDQIFTVNKSITGESTIQGAHESSSRKDISHEKQYFDGKYGGIQKIDLDNLQLDLF